MTTSSTPPSVPDELLTSHRDRLREQMVRYYRNKPKPRTAEELARDQIRGTAVVGMIVAGVFLLGEAAQWVGKWAGWW